MDVRVGGCKQYVSYPLISVLCSPCAAAAPSLPYCEVLCIVARGVTRVATSLRPVRQPANVVGGTVVEGRRITNKALVLNYRYT